MHRSAEYDIFGMCCSTILCWLYKIVGPGGTDFPNTKTAVTGRIVNENGSAGSSAIVHVLPHDFNPLSDASILIADSTDSDGYFFIPVEDSGVYNLHALHSHNGTRCLEKEIRVGGEEDTVKVGVVVLESSGTLVATIPEETTVAAGHVYFVGTQYHVPVAQGQRYVVFDSVPAGFTPSLCYTQTDLTEPIQIMDSAEVIAGDTTLVAPELGEGFLKVFFNTSGTGAGVSNDVYGFPVAIRVSSLPVDMNSFAAGGRDLVVTKNDFTMLPVQVETWDAESGDALVWVLVDTVFGNDSTQFLYIFWGAGEADSGKSTAGAVFDSSFGYSGVWHLDGGGSDATGNGNNGAKGASILDTVGILGGAQHFSGSDSIVVPGLLGRPSTVTLSAWAKLDSAVEYGAEVVTIGDAVVMRMDDTYNDKGCQGSFFSYPDTVYTMTHEFLGSGKFLAGKGWHYLAYVFDGQKMTHEFYLDGELCCKQQANVPIHYDSIGTDVVIGAHGNGAVHWHFIGSIDEVRIEHTIRGASWVRLCYMNQHAEDKMLFTKP